MAYRKTNVNVDELIEVPGGLNPGSQVVIRGRVDHHETRFCVNFRCGDEDIAFHFNPRNDQGDCVVRNTLQGGSWQEEERDTPFFPFNNGKKFTLRIVTTPDNYRIMVNNRDFAYYNHRIPPTDVTHVQLGGGAEYYEALVQNNCRAPFFGHFPGGLRVGQAVRVRGMVKDDADRFEVNFQNDRDGENIGLHFNPRPCQEDVVLNNRCNGDWGEEQRGFENNFAFRQGEFFEAFIIATEGKFNVYVNEKFFTCFDYRCDVNDMNFLTICGDVELMDVEIQNPLPDDYIKPVPQGLEKNDLIVVKGFFYPEGNRFAVNLIKGTCCDDDIALHFNPRRDDGEVVFNSREGGDWEEEERHSLPACMSEMVPFEVEIIVKQEKYKVFTNGKKICKFRARDDIEDIRAINVQGDAYIYEVKLMKRVDEPFTDTVPSKLEPGNWVVIVGAPEDDAENFVINLQCGEDVSSDDIAFHFNPRFNQGETVRNTREGGDWGPEEKDQPFFPFEPEDRFELAMVLLPHGIRVYVNHKRYTDYNYRINPDRICHLYLAGGCDYFEPEIY